MMARKSPAATCPPRALTLPALLLLLLCLSSLDRAAAYPCPTSAPWTRALKLAMWGLPNYFNSTYRVTTAANISMCRATAIAFHCNRTAPANFFAFAVDRNWTSSGVRLGNCAIGDACKTLAGGQADVTVSQLVNVNCNPPPPSPPPSPPLQGFCPGRGWPVRSIGMNSSSLIYNFLGSTIEVVDATSASDCQSQAQAARCSNSGTQFFVYMQQGFMDPVIGNMGNCAFGNGCQTLPLGSTPATIGRLTATCTSSL